ncbi:MAG: hypothetical protein KBS91_04145 [Firmicutes bacterium]|nr:hypothetical protein [Candidatus Caballimonas caccae]
MKVKVDGKEIDLTEQEVEEINRAYDAIKELEEIKFNNAALLTEYAIAREIDEMIKGKLEKK